MTEETQDDTAGTRGLPAVLGPGEADWRMLHPNGEGVGAKEDLRQMLLSSLQMENLILLAGSGCSISAGGPSMWDLWMNAVGTPPSETAVAVAAKVNYDLAEENIESLMSRAEAFLQVADDAEAEAFLRDAKSVILTMCSGFLGTADLSDHQILLHRLSRRRVRDQRLKVFTTNYDLCFERAASDLGGVALDGFSFTSPRRYDPNYFGYDIVRRPQLGEDHRDYLEGVFLLHKLHGSVNWARKPDGSIREETIPNPDEACLIYPATGKYQQSFAQPHLESVAQYLSAVRTPNSCILTVGFGFNDDHLAGPLLAAVRSNPHLRVVVVDPSARANCEDARHPHWTALADLSKRGEDVWFVAASFADFAPLIPDLKSLSPAVSLMRAIESVVDKR